jgi:hypothetical protein
VATPAIAKTNISHVSFAGSELSPTVTITGTGFGSREPKHAEYESCFSKSVESFFKNEVLYFRDLTRRWAAGNPFEPENCIGFSGVTWTKTQIVFKFGSDYRAASPWTLAPGNAFYVKVKKATFEGTVVY